MVAMVSAVASALGLLDITKKMAITPMMTLNIRMAVSDMARLPKSSACQSKLTLLLFIMFLKATFPIAIFA